MSQPNQNNPNFKDTKIFVGGLAWRTTTDELRRSFQQFGEVIDANVVSEGLQGGNLRSKGYGFVSTSSLFQFQHIIIFDSCEW